MIRASGLALSLACAFMFGRASFAPVAASSLEAGVLIQDGGLPLLVQGQAVPRVVDWDNDGKKDLIVGQYTNGNIRLYLNQGTNNAPAFNGYTLIQSGGTPITTSYSCNLGSSPVAVDWNNDGKKDLLVGERNGYVRIYLNVGTDGAPVFNGYTFLRVNGSTYCHTDAIPVVTDWNNDGKKDLVIGDSDGNVHLLINTGSDAAPVFTSDVLIQDGAGNLQVDFIRAAPWVTDWDGDGKKDLIVGGAGGELWYYRNVGTDAAPVFNGSQLLEAGGLDIALTANARPTVADWDGDGRPDILCGDVYGNVYYFHAIPSPVARFEWGAISSPQAAGAPFAVTLTARGSCNETVSDFRGTVALSGIAEDGVVFGAGATSWNCPVSTHYEVSRTQAIYLAAELGGARTINSLALSVTLAPGQMLEPLAKPPKGRCVGSLND
jgi:hypothetical protein